MCAAFPQYLSEEVTSLISIKKSFYLMYLMTVSTFQHPLLKLIFKFDNWLISEGIDAENLLLANWGDVIQVSFPISDGMFLLKYMHLIFIDCKAVINHISEGRVPVNRESTNSRFVIQLKVGNSLGIWPKRNVPTKISCSRHGGRQEGREEGIILS